MRRSSFALLCALGSLLVAQLSASAQTTEDNTPSPLTLEQVIAAANANYPAIRAA